MTTPRAPRLLPRWALVALGVTLAWTVMGSLAPAAESGAASDAYLIAKGNVTFRIYCASCHGAKGEGDGQLAEVLKVKPANLTVLARNAGGTFPREAVHARIDGRETVKGHGPSEMPVWGDAFKRVLQQTATDLTDEERAQLKIVELVYFLESIQKPVEPNP